MRGLLVAGMVLAALGRGAYAADALLPVKAPPQQSRAKPQENSYDWSGFYAGAHFGYAAGSSRWSAVSTGTTAPALTGSLDLFNGYDMFKGTGSYFAGFQGGYNYLLPSRLLLGVEADASFPNTFGGTATFSTPVVGIASYAELVEMSGTLRGRIGYAPSNWFLYATAGFAWSYDQFTRTQIAGMPVGGTAVPGTVENLFMVPRLGGAVGVGIELGLTPNWAGRLEYLYTDYGARSVTFPGGAQQFTSSLAVQSVRVGLDYQLGHAGIDPDIFTKGPSALDLDRFSFKGQTTFIEQYAPPFRSPYLGPHSLDPNQGRESFDVMYFVGAKLWQGAEFWVDPEIDQGFGIGNTEGIAGYPSGASFKVGASVPYTRVQRAFMRQTINLGGDSEKVEADQNQFAGSNTLDRLVITIGKYSVSDVFDQNKYAQNPRKDFMNWALIDTGTFDYAADAWGYSYGAAAEWYEGKWTLRAGVFDLTTVPNSQDLDPHFSQFQWLGEIERRYALWGHPGKIAFTGFLTRARLGSYDDAIALARVTGGPADIAAVRQYRSRTGLGVNLEQEITADLGLFARAGFASGNIEPDSYTDIDRTVAAGFALKGRQWHRPDDTFAVAAIVNGITKEHQAFLNAGGLGILVGDGILPHPGLEQIIETYYQLPIYAWHVTFDYQFVVNPAYNRDRGPVSVLGVRAQTEF
ncbi:MAG TPA: carbohydrate porin [Xanthobacteraceae bacterium]|jgi:high affinity Mn2+ porin|nr:carbohydrate porin [Xanthobacteraceae bacterium]